MAWSREKLVRRHVPDQLRARGETIETRIAEPGEMLRLLRDKLVEEVSELVEAIDAGVEDQIVEELADVVEVLRTFADSHVRMRSGKSFAMEVMVRRMAKREEKGGFTDIVMKLDEPIPMILHCPKCKAQHIDRGIFATTRVHRTHLCSGCGHTWRPHDKATVGVEALP